MAGGLCRQSRTCVRATVAAQPGAHTDIARLRRRDSPLTVFPEVGQGSQVPSCVAVQVAQRGRVAAEASGWDRPGQPCSWDGGRPLVVAWSRTWGAAGCWNTVFVEARHIQGDTAAAAVGVAAAAGGGDSRPRIWNARCWLVRDRDAKKLSGCRWSGSGFVRRADVRDRAAGRVARTCLDRRVGRCFSLPVSRLSLPRRCCASR